MPTVLTPDQADIAAQVLEQLRSAGDGSQTTVMSEPARQVLNALIARYARAANAARRVSQILLPPLPGDDDLAGAPIFADLADAQVWYFDNAEGIFAALVLASLHGVDEHVSRVVRGLEYVLLCAHDVDRSLALAEIALASARRLGDTAAEAHALLNRGGGHKMAGQPANAVQDYQQAATLLAAANDTAGTAAALSRLGVAHAAARQLDVADAAFNQLQALNGNPDGVLQALTYVNRAWIANQRGETDTAIAHGLAGLEALDDCNADKRWFPDAHLQLATAYTRTGDIDRARNHLSTASMLIAYGAGTVPLNIAATLTEGEVLLAQGHHRDALAAFQRAVLGQSAAPHPYRRPDAIDGVGEVLFELGEYEQAAEQHAAALAERTRAGEPFATARTLCHLAKAKAAAGRSEEAARLREQALLDLAGIVDPAADALRAELNRAV